MPLYETVMQEKPPMVLDIGIAYTKLGFAAEAYPRKIIPSEVTLTTSGVTKRLFDYDSNNDNEFYLQMVDFLQMIFFKHLLASPKDRKVVIVENIFGQTTVRETLARVLFVHFDISSVMFVPSHMISLSTLGISTAVVIDVGYSETTILPVYSGVQILPAFMDQAYGGRAIHKEIKRQLIESGVKDTLLTETVLEDIKVRLCFVTSLERALGYRKGEPPVAPPSIEYPICDEEIIEVPGRTRETVYEIMFEENHERDNLAHLILHSILQCPVDLRRELIESIFVIGGGAMVTGLLARLKQELYHLLEHDNYYKDRFHGDLKFKFYKALGKENFTAWMGGSLCGATDLIQTRSLTKEAYIRNKHVPDWVNLIDNRAATI